MMPKIFKSVKEMASHDGHCDAEFIFPELN